MGDHSKLPVKFLRNITSGHGSTTNHTSSYGSTGVPGLVSRFLSFEYVAGPKEPVPSDFDEDLSEWEDNRHANCVCPHRICYCRFDYEDEEDDDDDKTV